MSHTHKGESTTFHHNSDLSGDVQIVVPKDRLEQIVSAPGEGEHVMISVTGEDLLEFVGEIVRNRKIAVLEGLDAQRVLGFIP